MGDWQGVSAVFKVRRPMPYRLRVLDAEIRTRRTAREAAMLHASKGAGVPTPALYHLDLASSTIVMEYIEGERLKDAVGAMGPGAVEGEFRAMGMAVGRLHAAGIMHGDVTTANVVRRRGRLVFLDFGLSIRSDRLEDHAVDLRLVKETIGGAHTAVAGSALKGLFEGYEEVVGGPRSRAVQSQLRSIERRGRYARVE